VDFAALPLAVACTDAPQLREQAAAARGRIAALTGDRARIIAGNRAKLLSSLALVADLSCKADGAAVDLLIEEALEVGRQAEASTSEYEAARMWTEADLIASDAVALLVARLPAPSAP
jgi:hypothetical protein